MGADSMAKIELQGLDELNRAYGKIAEIPWDVTSEALNRMAAAAEAQVKRSGEAMGVRDAQSSVHILDKITHTKPKKTGDGGYSDVTFSGTRTRGRTRTRNAEIAFVNEYGRRGQAARPFIRQAAEQGADQIAAPGEKILGEWMEKTFNG